jgi:2-phospho-L-lactate guanylyltransferase (CobY/MobA/RfbA family)
VESLITTLADGVLRACQPLPTFVVGSGVAVEAIAARGAALFLDVAEGSLNADLTIARERIDAALTVVVLGDLVQPQGLGSYDFRRDVVTLVTDHHGSGTSVLAVPRGDFVFAFGPNSAAAHRAEAARRGWVVEELSSSPWRHDLDERADLEA